MSKQQRKSPAVKILIGVFLIGTSVSSIIYGPSLPDPEQTIGAKVAILGLLIAGLHLVVSGLKRWKA